MSLRPPVRRWTLAARPALTAALAALVVGTVLQAGLPTSSASPVAAPQLQQVAALTTRTVRITPAADTYLVASARRTTHGTRSYLFATRSVNRGFLKFDLRGRVPSGYRVSAASVQLYVLNISRGAPGLELHPVSNRWSERSLTASRRPAYDPRRLNRPYAVRGEHRWITVPLSDLRTLNVRSYTSFELAHRVTNSRLIVASSESSRKPVLQLTLTPILPARLSATPQPSPVTTTVPPVSTTTSPVSITTPPVSTTTSPVSTTTSPVSTTTSPVSTTTPPVSTTTAPATGTPWLPFDMPSSQVLKSSPKMLFAHYFTPFPRSIDNKAGEVDYYARNYLSPTGEAGKHEAYGGLLRDRPELRAPLPGAWSSADFQTEVRQAQTAGLDGFSVDMLSLRSYNYDRVVALMDAAHQVDPSFRILLQPDMTTLGSETPEAIAASVAALAAKPAAFRLADGRLVVSPFKAENKTVAWWTSWLATMKSQYGITVAFVPTLLDWQRFADAFAPICYGFSHWGLRNPGSNVDAAKHAVKAHAMGKIWMAPAHVQDVRPSGGIYDEAGNTETLRLSWQGVVTGNADWVNMPTWNDYSEGTGVAPSTQHGWSFLDISDYYLAQWKTGQTPRIVRDGLYLSHRTQKFAAKPSFPETKLMTLRANTTAARDTVEALVFLTAPARVTVSVGSATYTWDAPAGMNAKTFPLGYGAVSAAVTRGGVTTTSVRSPYAVTATPYVQDLQYDAVSSLR